MVFKNGKGYNLSMPEEEKGSPDVVEAVARKKAASKDDEKSKSDKGERIVAVKDTRANFTARIDAVVDTFSTRFDLLSHQSTLAQELHDDRPSGGEGHDDQVVDEDSETDRSAGVKGFFRNLIPSRFRSESADHVAPTSVAPEPSEKSATEALSAWDIANEAINGIKKESEELLKSLKQNTDLKVAFGNTFIDTQLRPSVAKLRNIDPEDADNYVELLREQLTDDAISTPAFELERNWHQRYAQIIELKQRAESYTSANALEDFSVDYKIRPGYASSQREYYDKAYAMLINQRQQTALQQLVSIVTEKDMPAQEKDELLRVIDRNISDSLGSGLLDDAVDFARWQILKNNSDAQKVFDESEFKQVEAAFFEQAVNKVLTNTDREKLFDLSKSLFKFTTAEAAPLVVLNCWREKGYNDDYPFLANLVPNGIAVENYVKSLPEAELAKLQGSEIPGLSDAIRIIKDNPGVALNQEVEEIVPGPQFESFAQAYSIKYGVSIDAAGREILQGGLFDDAIGNQNTVEYLLNELTEFNPEGIATIDNVKNKNAEELNEHLTQMAIHFLTQGDETERAIAIGLFGSSKLSLGTEGYSAVSAFLASSEGENQAEMVKMLARRQEDPKAVEVVLHAYPQLNTESQAYIKNDVGHYILGTFRGGATFDTESLQSLSMALDRDIGDVKNVVSLLESNSDIQFSFDAKNVDEFIRIANDPEIGKTITELKEYGYTLDIQHFDQLSEVAENREAIIAKIKQIREVKPDFSYTIVGDRLGDNEWRLVTDPYEVFVKNYNDSLYALEDIRKQGPISSEFTDAFLKHTWKRYGKDRPDLIPEQSTSFNQNIDFLIGDQKRKLSDAQELQLGESFMHMTKYYSDILLMESLSKGVRAAESILKTDASATVTAENWQQMLLLYIRSQDDLGHLHDAPPNPKATERIKSIFEDSKVKDFCLEQVNQSWQKYLNAPEPAGIPYSLQVISRMISLTDGAGNLGQLESLQKFTQKVGAAMVEPELPANMKQRIKDGLRETETRFTSEKWSNEAKTDFYDISGDILAADPELFSEYFEVFSQLSPAEMKRFAKEIYPFYRAQLVMLEKNDKSHDMEDIAALKADILGFKDRLVSDSQEDPFAIQKAKLSEKTKELFQSRFGITKLPEVLTPESIRSLNNFTLYVSNLNNRNSSRENILGFYLSLKMNGDWDAFRRGESVDPSQYMIPEKSSELVSMLRQREELSPINPENVGISAEDMPEFQRMLQQETQNVVIGNIETIDVKLTNVILNLRTITDMDLYPDPLDQKRMELLIRYGNKKVGSVVARMYQQAVKPEKKFTFLDDDEQIRSSVLAIMQDTEGLDASDPQTLKAHFQDGMRPLATGINLLSYIDQSGAEVEVGILQDRLVPSGDVIDIFKRLGEDFKPTSGALALSQDLTYLDTLIVKREDELQAGEKELLIAYTGSIREQVVKLEAVYEKISEKFKQMRQSSQGSQNALLEAKFADIDRVINTQSSQQAITSTITEDMNAIIENMRECLSCKRQGANNDTNLTYGDSNKFYIYSSTETQTKGSISDQVVFFEPMTHADGSKDMAFVFDRVYGTNTPTILRNQVDTVLKKARGLKAKFPGAKLSLFITSAALSSGGISTENFMNALKSDDIAVTAESVNVDVAQSAFADHYVEFGGSVRSPGERQVEGITIAV
jgi:hypothetical protein